MKSARTALRVLVMLSPALLRKGSDNHVLANSGSMASAVLYRFQEMFLPKRLDQGSLADAATASAPTEVIVFTSLVVSWTIFSLVGASIDPLTISRTAVPSVYRYLISRGVWITASMMPNPLAS